MNFAEVNSNISFLLCTLRFIQRDVFYFIALSWNSLMAHDSGSFFFFFFKKSKIEIAADLFLIAENKRKTQFRSP